jgi:hypothetical protein
MVQIHSRFEIMLAIPDLDTNNNLYPDPRKVVQSRNRIAIADPDPLFADSSQIMFNRFWTLRIFKQCVHRIALQTERF